MNIHNLTIEHLIDNDTGSAQIRDAIGRLWTAHKIPVVTQRKHNKIHSLNWCVQLPEGLLWDGEKENHLPNDLSEMLSFISGVGKLESGFVGEVTKHI